MALATTAGAHASTCSFSNGVVDLNLTSGSAGSAIETAGGTIAISDAAKPVTCAGGTPTTTNGIENLYGTSFDDTLIRDEAANVLKAGGGNDTLDAAGPSRTVVLRLTQKQLAAIRRALAATRTPTLTVRAEARDAAGNRVVLTLRVRVRS